AGSPRSAAGERPDHDDDHEHEHEHEHDLERSEPHRVPPKRQRPSRLEPSPGALPSLHRRLYAPSGSLWRGVAISTGRTAAASVAGRQGGPLPCWRRRPEPALVKPTGASKRPSSLQPVSVKRPPGLQGEPQLAGLA